MSIDKAEKIFKEATKLWNDHSAPGKVIKKFEEAAQMGHGEAMATLGSFYEFGTFGEQNGDLAIEWYKKAYQNDFEPIVVNIGNIYFNGELVERNVPEAIKWYEIAANNGDAQIQGYLGSLYYNGDGVEPNFNKASYWFQQAADNGHKNSLNNLWIMYNEGHNIHLKGKELYHYVILAGNNGNSDALCKAASMLITGDGIEVNKELALTCYKLASSFEDGYAACCAGDMYKELNDYDMAFKYYSQSADLGYPIGKYKLGICYMDGIGVEANPKLEDYWFNQAHKSGVNLQTGKMKN